MKKILVLTVSLIISVFVGFLLVHKSLAYMSTLPTGTINASDWAKVDPANNKISITNGNLVLTPGTTGAWDSGVISEKATPNQAGSVFYSILKTGSSSNYFMVGFGQEQVRSPSSSAFHPSYTFLNHALYFANGAFYVFQNGINKGTFGAGYSANTVYEVSIMLNADLSATYSIRGGAYNDWTTLLGADSPITISMAGGNLREQIAQYQGSATFATLANTGPVPIPSTVDAGTLTSSTTTDYCSSTTISQTTLDAGQELTITTTANSSDVVSYGWWFYNLDNVDATTSKPMPIMFVASTPYGRARTLAVGSNSQSFQVGFGDIERPDWNWKSFTPRPKRIEVDAYFKKPGETVWTKFNAACSVKFSDTAVDPTPVPVPSCLCSAAGACDTTCVFNKLGGITYSSPISCSQSTSLFSSAPSATNKNNWCQRFTRTAGDANGDGQVNMLDYFYYVQAIYGGKVPPTVNLDFNGDGFITSVDHDILIKALKP